MRSGTSKGSTISQYGYSTFGALATEAQYKEEEEHSREFTKLCFKLNSPFHLRAFIELQNFKSHFEQFLQREGKENGATVVPTHPTIYPSLIYHHATASGNFR